MQIVARRASNFVLLVLQYQYLAEQVGSKNNKISSNVSNNNSCDVMKDDKILSGSKIYKSKIKNHMLSTSKNKINLLKEKLKDDS